MTRMSKQGERRARCPKKNKAPAKKTGPLKDNLPLGYKEHVNAAQDDLGKSMFVAKLK